MTSVMEIFVRRFETDGMSDYPGKPEEKSDGFVGKMITQIIKNLEVHYPCTLSLVLYPFN